MRIAIFLSLLAAVSFAPAASAQTYDLVVYGGTAGGVITAVSAAREGLNVALLEPGKHLGGMATGGLSRTDFGKKEVVGGYALEFYWRVGQKYDLSRYAQSLGWYYEPHIGEQVFAEMLREAKVTFSFNTRLREGSGVTKNGAAIQSITTEDGKTISARVFADCSYEGDLMAQAHVSYTWGREASSQYGESLAGVRDRTPFHQFLVPVKARDDNGQLLPEISSQPKGETGSADRKVQAYNFRMILTNEPANRIPFPKPEGYDPHRYELLARLLKANEQKLGRAPKFRELDLIALIPNGKADFNNQGPFSTDYIGGSWGYPEGNYAKRNEIWQQHIRYTQGFFYFLSHDSRVPASLAAEVNSWGLPKDEYQDTGGWPHQLYIREARRMVSDFVLTQKDLQTDLSKPDPIGMGSYNSDSHNIQRIVNAEGNAENEGDMQVPVTPYQIPYRIMVPKASETSNLLVPVCFSASHVAYSSARMEPQYMIIGQAAGLAAAMSIHDNKPVASIDAQALGQKLINQGAMMEYHPAPALPPSVLQMFRSKAAGAGFSPEFFGR